MAALAALLLFLMHRSRVRGRELFIEQFRFGSLLQSKLLQHYPHLTEVQAEKVLRGLRDYFLICLRAGRRPVAMPSQAVDVVWHQFILNTRAYQQFCKQGLGRFLHHTPTEAMTSPTVAQEGIKRCWRIACHRERINPQTPVRLPLLFALDAELAIPDGFHYALDCESRNGQLTAAGYCASHIGCSSGCAGDSGSGSSGSWFDSGDSGCSSGCGGD